MKWTSAGLVPFDFTDGMSGRCIVTVAVLQWQEKRAKKSS